MTTRMNPYIILDGNAKEAIDFYVNALEADVIGIQSFGDMPESPDYLLPEEVKDRVSHALLIVGETELMFSDTFPGQPITKGNHVAICIITNQAEKSNQYFEALQQGGTVQMPIQKTFWSSAYGIVTDRFGVTFHISTDDKQ